MSSVVVTYKDHLKKIHRMAQRTYHPLAKLAFAAVAVLTLLTLTIHGRRSATSSDASRSPGHTENFQFSTPQQ